MKKEFKTETNEKAWRPVKIRATIGGVAIFVVSLIELWKYEDLTKPMAVMFALFFSVAVSFFGYLLLKFIMKSIYRK